MILQMGLALFKLGHGGGHTLSYQHPGGGGRVQAEREGEQDEESREEARQLCSDHRRDGAP